MNRTMSVITTVALIFVSSAGQADEPRPNVLFITVDDLRPELGCYGSKHIHSPNIDKLAESGRLFERAYCQQAVCNPSRTSLMTGMRPDSIGVTGNHSHFRSNHPDVVTLPQHFRKHGYRAAAIGKIYHGVFPDGTSNTKWDTMGDPQSWSEPAVRFGPRYYYTEDGIAAAKDVFERIYKPKNPGPDDWTKKLVFGPATEAPDVPDGTLYDGKVAEAAVKKLQELKGKDTPFFLAVGFIKPHSPYIAPKKYFDLYRDVDLPSTTEFPVRAPKFAGHGSEELRRYTDQPKSGAIPEGRQRRVRHAYFACVSYIDTQIGRVLGELERAGLSKNTIVVLFGDHGYHLGEQGLWGKTTNFELDTRVPLIVRVPGMKAAGKSTSSLVELVDLYPTLAELAGLPISDQLEGKSFARILNDPAHETKTEAFSQFPRGGGLMGYSMRTPTHRLMHWVHRQTGEIRETELYDYAEGLVELKNIADTSPAIVERLTPRLVSVAGLAGVQARDQQDGSDRSVEPSATAGFESAKAGPFDKLETSIGVWTRTAGKTIVDEKHAKTGKQSLQLTGGEKTSVTLDLAGDVDTSGQLTFWAERWTRREPFSFRIEKDVGDGWAEVFNGDKQVRVGRAFLSHVTVPLGDRGIKQLRFTVTSPTNTGVLLDDIKFAPARPQRIVNVEPIPLTLPALVGVKASPLLKLKVTTQGSLNPISLTELRASLLCKGGDVQFAQVYFGGASSQFTTATPFGKPIEIDGLESPEAQDITGKQVLVEGENYLWIACRLRKDANIDHTVGATCERIRFSNGKAVDLTALSTQRLGVAVRDGGDDGVHTFRIPGLATTNKGTLIGVYDVRRRGGGDLPGDIDVGMSRSTDGGRTWKPMKVVMDMGDDPDWRYDGIGDPAVLVDRNTGTIWVAATWSHGNRSWFGSGPGLKPEETGQFMLVRSDDDGLTWSKPINITKQVKKPGWCFILQGPGKGITMRDGTIVFAAQYQDPPNTTDKRAHRLPHSTIIYSKDHGKTWSVGTGAFDDTTESQVVEIEPGVLMLNCRYNRKAARVVMTTRDMGRTWQKHTTSERALIEPGSCMASLIDVDREVGRDVGNWLLFSNPDSTRGRHHITIKASADRGVTWSKKHRLLLDEGNGRGYSCMSMIDGKTVGILYEGSQAHMTFQRVPLDDLVQAENDDKQGAADEAIQPRVRVACVGDSITFGHGIKNREKRSYPAQLQRMLGDRFDVRNFGVSGTGVLQEALRTNGWKRWYGSKPEYEASLDWLPDIVVINLGINDVVHWKELGSKFTAEYVALIESYQNLPSRPQVFIWYPLAPLFKGHAHAGDPNLKELNRAIAAAAAKTNAQTIDLASPLVQHPEWFPDRIHPNGEGAENIAKVIATAFADAKALNRQRVEPRLLSPLFGDHMVLQAEMPIPVWGKATPGTEVRVQLGSERKEAVADSKGEWQVRLEPRRGSQNPLSLTVHSKDRQQILRDILIGEVWICAGQSNMEWTLRQSVHGKEELNKADHHHLRLLFLQGGARGSSGSYTRSHLARLTPENYSEGRWRVASAESAQGFSAVAWYFGRHLQEQLKVPVGLICPAVGGTPTEAWIPREALQADPDLKRLVAGNWLDNPRLSDFCRRRAEQNLLAAIQAGERIPGDEFGPNHSFKPGFMWDAGIEPLIPYAVRGAIWYQGESNAETPARVREHGRLLPLLINQWRTRWGQGDFPFLYVQLPALNRPEWPWFRDGQRRVLSQLKNVGMATTIDTGHPSNVHPTLKKPVGVRLAKWALGTTYGKSTTYSGPLLDVTERKGNSLVIGFQHVGDGLKSSDDKPLRYFEVCGKDGVFYPATAKIIRRNAVAVSSPKVPEPVDARYAWLPYPDPQVNLFNSANFPASPFSTETTEQVFTRRTTAAQRPNILLIVSEDNSEHLGCYGEQRVHTPHLDSLASGGVRYTRAYVPYSVCSPSRAAFLTGLYTRQTGHIGLATHRFSMYRDFKTIPAYLRQAGYYTGFLGKTHVNPERIVEDYIDHCAIRNSNFGKTISIETYASEARTVMENAAKANKPFLLIINYADAHRKFIGKSKNGFPTRQVTEPVEPFPWIGSDTPRLREETRDYFNCMNRLDEGVGMVLKNLDEMNVRDDTLIIYISDHGADFPRGKGSIYENGTRIPMIVNYPQNFPRGKVESGLVSTIDILPTMLRAARLPVPEKLPGIALQDIDSGRSPSRKYIHTFTTGSSPNLLYMQFGVRDARYKLVYNPDRALNRLAESRYRNSQLPVDQHVQSFLHPPEYELFDLQEDPYEWKNLADSAEHKPIRERLFKAMLDFQREIKDPFASRENIATFIAEQKEYQHKPYKTSGFRWPHLDMFKAAQETGE